MERCAVRIYMRVWLALVVAVEYCFISRERRAVACRYLRNVIYPVDVCCVSS